MNNLLDDKCIANLAIQLTHKQVDRLDLSGITTSEAIMSVFNDAFPALPRPQTVKEGK